MSSTMYITHTGFGNTDKYFANLISMQIEKKLRKYGERGKNVLQESTPKDTGKTSESWNYKIVKNNGKYQLIWTNDNNSNGVSIVILLQYGHANQNGVWIDGIDFINPALKPVFDDMADDMRKYMKFKK